MHWLLAASVSLDPSDINVGLEKSHEQNKQILSFSVPNYEVKRSESTEFAFISVFIGDPILPLRQFFPFSPNAFREERSTYTIHQQFLIKKFIARIMFLRLRNTFQIAIIN